MAASVPTNAPNLNAASHAAFLVPAKGCEAPKPLLAHTSNVAIGLLHVGGACKRELADGG